MAPRLKAPDGHKCCSTCMQIKLFDEFYNHKMGGSGRGAVCKICSRARQVEYWRTDKGRSRIRSSRCMPSGRTPQLICAARHRARTRGLEFNLTRDWVLERIARGCEATGLPFVLTGDSKNGRLRSPWSPSIDRIDTNRGYTQDNCRMVVLAFNTARSDWGDETVRKMCLAFLGLPQDNVLAISSGRNEMVAVH